MSQQRRILTGVMSIVAAGAVISVVTYAYVLRPALEIKGHKQALREGEARAREKRHSLPSDAELYEYKQHVIALVKLGHFQEREFRVDMNALAMNQRQLFRALDRQADGLPVWEWKPTLEKDAIVITVRARPEDMKYWARVIERYT
jgi:hypothetical protein